MKLYVTSIRQIDIKLNKNLYISFWKEKIKNMNIFLILSHVNEILKKDSQKSFNFQINFYDHT